MTTINLPVTEVKWDGQLATSDAVLVVGLQRFKVSGIRRGYEGRKVFGGPMVPGPWAFANAQAVAITANPMHGSYGDMVRAKAEGRWYEVAEGDRVVFDGVEYEIVMTDGFGRRNARRREYMQLVGGADATLRKTVRAAAAE